MRTRRQFGVAALGAVALALFFGGESRAGFMVSTPAGIGPGQSFIVMFVDSIGGDAQSPLTSTYNTRVASAASGITYAGSIGSWVFLGSAQDSGTQPALYSSMLPQGLRTLLREVNPRGSIPGVPL